MTVPSDSACGVDGCQTAKLACEVTDCAPRVQLTKCVPVPLAVRVVVPYDQLTLPAPSATGWASRPWALL